MGFAFNFGISQDDARSESQFLDLKQNDRVLCLASGGEVPLDLISSCEGIHVDAVDIDPHQIFLAKLKLKAAIHLNPQEAAQLIGYTSGELKQRLHQLSKLKPFLSRSEIDFWNQNLSLFNLGPIHAGRFETYIRKFNPIVNTLLGKKHLVNLMKMNDLHEQEVYFDQHFRTNLLKLIFKFAFHPLVYKNRGVVEVGLQHSRNSHMAEFFYGRFRSFCIANLARKNGYYQFTFFNEILRDDALPDFLQENNLTLIQTQYQQLEFKQIDVREQLSKVEFGHYSKIALSNISDWLSQEEMSALLDLILRKSTSGTRILARFIHAPVVLEGISSTRIKIDYEEAKRLVKKERYPFYSLVPLIIE